MFRWIFEMFIVFGIPTLGFSIGGWLGLIIGIMITFRIIGSLNESNYKI